MGSASDTAGQDSGTEDPTEYPNYNGPGWVDILQNLQVGDRVHIELASRQGKVQWRSYWITDVGDGYVEFGDYRIEVTDIDEYCRRTPGDGGIHLLEKYNGEFFDEDWTDTLNGIERVPASAFEEQTWYQWEVSVSETKGGGVSTDMTVYPEAPNRKTAEEKAKRWAAMSTGYTPVVYKNEEVRPR